MHDRNGGQETEANSHRRRKAEIDHDLAPGLTHGDGRVGGDSHIAGVHLSDSQRARDGRLRSEQGIIERRKPFRRRTADAFRLAAKFPGLQVAGRESDAESG